MLLLISARGDNREVTQSCLNPEKRCTDGCDSQPGVNYYPGVLTRYVFRQRAC